MINLNTKLSSRRWRELLESGGTALWEVITAQISVHHTDESVDKTLILNGHYTDSAVWCTMIHQCY